MPSETHSPHLCPELSTVSFGSMYYILHDVSGVCSNPVFSLGCIDGLFSILFAELVKQYEYFELDRFLLVHATL